MSFPVLLLIQRIKKYTSPSLTDFCLAFCVSFFCLFLFFFFFLFFCFCFDATCSWLNCKSLVHEPPLAHKAWCALLCRLPVFINVLEKNPANWCNTHCMIATLLCQTVSCGIFALHKLPNEIFKKNPQSCSKDFNCIPAKMHQKQNVVIQAVVVFVLIKAVWPPPKSPIAARKNLSKEFPNICIF